MSLKCVFHRAILPVWAGWLFICLFLLAGADCAQAAAEAPVSENVPSAMAGESAKGNEDEDAENVQQTVYPGVENQLLERGGTGAPSVALNCPRLGQEKVDADLRRWLESLAGDYVAEVALSGGEGVPSGYEQWEMLGRYEISRPGADVVSIVFVIESYTGGAHGNMAIVCRNYDLRSGRRLGFADLFANPEAALKLLSAWTERELLLALGDEANLEMIKAGTAPEMENFANLRLTPE
ncbi:MAG: DUF3298/DUF4163 domain-containing protein, partial [Desulfovibrionaceae bacterium]|nr:DUF3298/DUF4163 domain-containing protein [Desulfovibrionaceae bacterium]